MAIQPYHDRDGFIWQDGALVPWREAKHVLSHGLHYASAVFEGARAYGGVIFKLTEHSQRLADRRDCWVSNCRARWMTSIAPATRRCVRMGSKTATSGRSPGGAAK